MTDATNEVEVTPEVIEDVIQEPLEQIGQRIDAGYKRTQRGRQEWFEGTLELASALAAARDQFRSNEAFSTWLSESGRDLIGHQDRAALIKMASADAIQVTRSVLAETQRTSWRLIWAEEIEPRLTNAGKTAKIISLTKRQQKGTPITDTSTIEPHINDVSIEADISTAEINPRTEQIAEATPRQTVTPNPEGTSPPRVGRVEHYIAAARQFSTETKDAMDCVDEFSPEAAAQVSELIDEIKNQLDAFRQGLRKDEMESSTATQH